MRNIVITVFGLILLILECLGYPEYIQAAQYHSVEAHYSLSIPNSWMEIPDYIINEAQQKMASQTKDNAKLQKISYDCGLQMTNQNNMFFKHPYVLVQVINTGQPTIKDLKSIAGSNTDNYKKVLNNNFPAITLSNIDTIGNYYSESDHSVFLSQVMNIPSIGDVVMLQKGFAGKGGIVSIYFYCLKDKLETDQKYFNEIISSFSYDKGYEYQENTSSDVGEKIATKTMSWVFIIVIILAIKAVVDGWRKRKHEA